MSANFLFALVFSALTGKPSVSGKTYTPEMIVTMIKHYAEVLPPPLEITLLRPRGLKVSLPDFELIKSFEFNANINRVFKQPPVSRKGQIRGIVTKPVNGKWTYYNHTTEFKFRDKVYYWCCILMIDDHQVFKVDHDFTVGANFTVPLLGRSDFFKLLPKAVRVDSDPEELWNKSFDSLSYYMPHKSHYVLT